MKITERWNQGTPSLSLEVFPARTAQSAATLDAALNALIAIRPDFMSVTFGAGGSTRQGSRELVAKLKQQGVLVLAYFAAYGLGPDAIRAVLDDYAQIGVENLLAVRGDIPKEASDFQPHPDSFAHASDLIAWVRPLYPFCLGAAGYPEGHVEAVSKDKDLDFLKLKVDHGAQFVIANYCYDNTLFFSFVDRCRAAGIQVPILPGVMPIYSVKMMENLASLCGATITPAVRNGLSSLPQGDKEAVNRFGIDFATAQCANLLRAGVPGIHIYTMDRSASAVEVARRLRAEGLLPKPT
jgi:methylenetetrahydrofolate reductase (NADPH)